MDSLAVFESGFRRANELSKNGQFAEALEELGKVQPFRPAEIERVQMVKVDLLCKLNRPQEASDALGPTPRPYRVSTYTFKKIEILTLWKRFDEARHWCDILETLKADGTNSPAASPETLGVLRAKLYEAEGNHSAAVDEVNKAYRWDVQSFVDLTKIKEVMASMHMEPPVVPIPTRPAMKYDPALDEVLFNRVDRFDSILWKQDKRTVMFAEQAKTRARMLADLISSFPLIGMNSANVQELLGEPRHYPCLTSKTDVYLIEEETDGGGCTSNNFSNWLELNYSESGTVQSIAIRNGDANYVSPYNTRSRLITANKLWTFGSATGFATKSAKNIESTISVETLPPCLTPIYLARRIGQLPMVWGGRVLGSQDNLAAAYRSAAKSGRNIEQELLYVFDHAQPEGKYLAACLIGKFDKDTGGRLLTGLLRFNKTETVGPGGYRTWETSLGVEAKNALARLRNEPVVKSPTSGKPIAEIDHQFAQPYLGLLFKANQIDLYANDKATRELRAAYQTAKQAGAGIRDQLKFICDNGSFEGRFLSACLLAELDKDAAARCLQILTCDISPEQITFDMDIEQWVKPTTIGNEAKAAYRALLNMSSEQFSVPNFWMNEHPDKHHQHLY